MASTKMRVLALGVVSALVAVGCGDDDSDAGTPAPVEETPVVEDETGGEPVDEEPAEPDGEVTESPTEDAPTSPIDEYCAVIEEVGDELPTDEQFDRLLAAAPAEIAESLGVVVDAIRAEGEAAFSDPDVVANFPVLEVFEAENCGGGTATEVVNPDAERIDVTATEYAFDYTTPSTGAVSFVISNPGVTVHEVILARFVGDTTLEDALAAEDPEAEGLVETVGFAGPVAPGGELVLNVDDLVAGRYAMVCLIPAPDGVSHAEKGMVSEFTVG